MATAVTRAPGHQPTAEVSESCALDPAEQLGGKPGPYSLLPAQGSGEEAQQEGCKGQEWESQSTEAQGLSRRDWKAVPESWFRTGGGAQVVDSSGAPERWFSGGNSLSRIWPRGLGHQKEKCFV